MPDLITSRAELLLNAQRHDRAITDREALAAGHKKTLGETITRANAWYALYEDGKWICVPAKFGGYADMSVAKYEKNRKDISGTTACHAIDKLGYKAADDSHPAYKVLRRRVARVGLSLKTGSGLYIIDGEELPAGERQKAEAIISELTTVSEVTRKFIISRAA